MMYRGCATAILLLAWTAFCGPLFSVGANVGGTESGVEVSKMPQGISTTANNWTGYVMFGLFGEMKLSEYFGAGIGASYEARGGSVDGYIPTILGVVTGGETFDYRYLQIPFYMKGTIPLMIPGSVFVTLGPELGVKLESQRTTKFYNVNIPGYPKMDNIDSITEPLDFGVSASLGYELPISWFGGLRACVGYYYSFIDIYHDKTLTTTGTSLDYDIFNRAFKYGLSFYVNINAARRR
ncbi:MAG TPA: porin family protein [Chitinivibrionales bacterium]|jgi:hypothetical protein|nr:porin family protein [Chitinivibrionales bacterium]